MKLTMISVCLATATALAHAEALTCKEFLELAPPTQAIFVSGLVDGMRTMHGVNDTFARHIKAASSSDEEKSGVEKLRSLPQRYLSKGDTLSKVDIANKIVKGCKAKPDLPVGNFLTDTMSGEL